MAHLLGELQNLINENSCLKEKYNQLFSDYQYNILQFKERDQELNHMTKQLRELERVYTFGLTKIAH